MNEPRPEPNSELKQVEPLRVIFAVLALLLGVVATARAAPGSGEMHVRAADGAELALPSMSTEVDYRVNGMIAEVSVHQRFRNDGAAWIEGQYLLPLPEGAAVHALQLTIGKRVIVGEIREKEQARSEYAAAVATGRKASLVEAEAANLFRTAVANVAPGEMVDVTIGYWQRVDYRDGEFSVTFPLTFTPRYAITGADAPQRGFETGVTAAAAAAPVETTTRVVAPPQVTIRVALDAGIALQRVESSTHTVVIDRRGDRYAVTLQEAQVKSDRDFVLRWMPVPQATPTAAVFTERSGDANYALVMMMPPTVDAAALPRELILVIDTSGSMQGASLVQAKSALDFALARLRPGDRFNVVQFNSVTEALFDTAVPASAKDVALAREWVARLQATGGTEMGPALALALAGSAPEGFVRQVVFATDGAVSGEDALYALIETKLDRSRLFPIGIGSAPNGHFLVKAAQLGRGVETIVRDINEVGERLQALFAKLDRPALRDLQLVWPARAEVYPQRLPDLYRGEPLLVVAKIDTMQGTVKADGWLADAPWSSALTLQSRANADGIARLWARQKIAALDDARIGGADEAMIRAQTLDVALAHHLVSRYTSLVAIDRTPQRPANEDLENVEVANETPDGSLAFAQTATDARLRLVFGAFALLLALGLRRTRATHDDAR